MGRAHITTQHTNNQFPALKKSSKMESYQFHASWPKLSKIIFLSSSTFIFNVIFEI